MKAMYIYKYICMYIYVCIYIYMHKQRHTRMNVGVYDCMRSDSESELGHQLSGILREANKHALSYVHV
jgi:hypothetical protein